MKEETKQFQIILNFRNGLMMTACMSLKTFISEPLVLPKTGMTVCIKIQDRSCLSQVMKTLSSSLKSLLAELPFKPTRFCSVQTKLGLNKPLLRFTTKLV